MTININNVYQIDLGRYKRIKTALNFEQPEPSNIIPYPYQSRIIKSLRKESNVILDCPTGSGKSYIIVQDVLRELKDTDRNIIIATPQTNIGKNFQDPFLSERITCTNLCDTLVGGTVDYLRNFIKIKGITPSNRVVISTHQALVYAIEKIDKNALQNITLWIDEAHHIQNDEAVSNKLGSIINYYARKDLNVHIKGATATPFRGDDYSLIPKDLEDSFKYLKVEYDEYLDVLYDRYGFEGFGYNFVIYNGDAIKAIKSLKRKKGFGKFTAIYIPSTDSNIIPDERDDKFDNKFLFAENLQKIVGRNCINMVDNVDRSLKQEQLRNYDLNSNGAIFQGIGKEGFDRTDIDTIIIIGPRNSKTEVIQIIGRGLRGHPGKRFLNVYHVLPFSVKLASEEEQRERANNYLKYHAFAMVMQNDIFAPVKIPQDIKKSNKKSTNVTKQIKLQAFKKAVPNIHDRTSIMENICREIFNIKANNNSKITFDTFNSVVKNKLTNANVDKKHHNKIAKQLWIQQSRNEQKINKKNVKDIHVDLIKGTDKLNFDFVEHFSRDIGAKDLKHLRDLIKNLPKITIEYVKQIIFLNRCLHFKNIGKYRDPRNFSGAIKLFGSKEELDRKCTEVGL